MCDPTPIRNWMIACAVAVIAATAIVIGAAVANGSWWYTYLSPVGMVVAAAATGAAIGFCAAAVSALDTYCGCIGSRCKGTCDNVRATLKAPWRFSGFRPPLV